MNLIPELPFHTQLFLFAVVGLTVYFHVNYGEKTLIYGPTILTTTGIFATFLGIALGLADFDATNIQASVPDLLDGLKTAFWASVAGVGGALTLKFRHFFFEVEQNVTGSGVDGEITATDLAALLQSIQQALVGNDDSTLVSQLKLSRSDSNDRLDALKKSHQEALEKMSQMGTAALIEALKEVITDFNANLTEQFGENFKQLNDAVGKLLVWQEQYKSHIEVTTERQTEIVGSMQVASDNYQTLVTKAERFTAVSKDLSDILTGLETQKQQLGSMLKALANLLESSKGALPEIETKVMELTGQLTRSVEANQQQVNLALTENAVLMKNSVKDVKEGLVTTNKAFNEHIVSLTTNTKNSIEANLQQVNKALLENMQLLTTSINGVGQDLSKTNQEFNKHIADLAEKTNKQVSVLDAALSEELTKSLESLGRQLTALSKRFIDDYSPLTEQLRNVVQLANRLQ